MKNVKYNFIAICVVASALLVFAAICFYEAYRIKGEGSALLKEAAALIDGSVSDVEGYGAILYFLSGSGAAFAHIFIMAVGILALLYSIPIFVLACIAKHIYQSPEGRLTLYRILMGIVYGMLALLEYIMLSLCHIKYFTLVCIPCLIIITSILIFEIRNTYTSRIKITK